MKVIGYCRVSTLDQTAGTSPENQRLKIQKYCDYKGFDLLEIIEESRSAKNLNRPGMQRILKMVKAKEIDGIIVNRMDRAFRSVLDAESVLKEFQRAGVSFHSIHEEINTDNSHGKFIYTMLNACAELERNRLSERMKESCALKRAKGEKMGNWIRYGFDLRPDGKRMKKNVKEQKVIKKIIRFNEIGKNLSEISRYLNMKGIPTKNGKKWNPQQVKNILRYEEV